MMPPARRDSPAANGAGDGADFTPAFECSASTVSREARVRCARRSVRSDCRADREGPEVPNMNVHTAIGAGGPAR